jgi:hypothetical protein
VRIGWLLGFRAALRLKRGAGEYAARVCFSDHGSEASFRLLDRLLSVGEEGHGPPADGTTPRVRPSAPPSSNGDANGNGRADGNGEARDDFVHAVVRARATVNERADDSGDEAAAGSNGNGNGHPAPRRPTRS